MIILLREILPPLCKVKASLPCLGSLTKANCPLSYFLFIFCCMCSCFVLFQTVLFSSFSGILSLICFTNCPRALWCFHIDTSFSVTPCPHQKQKAPKAPKDQPYLSLHTCLFFFLPPLNFSVKCFQFSAFFGGVDFTFVKLNSLKGFTNLVDS